jgi:hypothetical protein
MGHHDPGDGGLPVGERQRQAVRDVGADREHEGVLVAAVEEDHVDRVLTAQPRRTEPVHPVDDAHGRAVHQDRRQGAVRFGQHPDVLGVLADESRRVGRLQLGHRNRVGDLVDRRVTGRRRRFVPLLGAG